MSRGKPKSDVSVGLAHKTCLHLAPLPRRAIRFAHVEAVRGSRRRVDCALWESRR